jgi:PERQ amino acid-rich with GYF domain-containing protein
MQKWFDEGYFTPDLLMKRTHIDADWIAVGILERRAVGGTIFLSQISNSPPGLVIHTESPKSYSPVHEQNMFSGYQPVPTRTLRTTLDSYLNGSSPTESPSSPLGAGRFGNGSPDPCTFSGRAGSNVYSSDPSFGGRSFGGRAAFQDSVSDARTLNNTPLGRAPTIDTFNAYGGGGDSSPWSAGPGQITQGFNDNEQHPYSNGFNGTGSGIGSPLPVTHVHSINQEHFGDTTYSGMSGLNGRRDSPIARQPSEVNGMSFNSNPVNGLGSQFGAPTQFSQSPSVPHGVPQHRQSVSPFGDLLPQTSEAPNVAQTPTSAIQLNGASPWTTRTQPFEPPAAPSPVVPPPRPQPTQPVDPSPWLIASLPVVDDAWREMPGPNSLTFSNLGQHNKLQQQEENSSDDGDVPPMEDAVPLPLNTQLALTESANAVSASVTTTVSQAVTSATTSAPTPGTPGPTTQKARRKSTTRDVQAPALKVAPPSTPTVVRDQPPTPAPPAAQPKPAWVVEDDSKKQKGAGVTTSLREIQEAEVREAEARKAAEKERERLARANAAASGNSATEESQLFTSSWGLPTSQVGARNLSPPKETSTNGSISTTPAAPVWTNATPAPTAKKTMKEIQEEEERRKKLAVKESMASATARRAYAETTVKVYR